MGGIAGELRGIAPLPQRCILLQAVGNGFLRKLQFPDVAWLRAKVHREQRDALPDVGRRVLAPLRRVCQRKCLTHGFDRLETLAGYILGIGQQLVGTTAFGDDLDIVRLPLRELIQDLCGTCDLRGTGRVIDIRSAYEPVDTR